MKAQIKTKLMLLKSLTVADIGTAGDMIWIIFDGKEGHEYHLHISYAYLLLEANAQLLLDSSTVNWHQDLKGITSKLVGQKVTNTVVVDYFDVIITLSNKIKLNIYTNLEGYLGEEKELWRLFQNDKSPHFVVTTTGIQGLDI